MSLLQNSNAIPQIGGYNLTDSLRFRQSASAYLSRTPASAGNRQIFTYSAWVKRGSLGSRQAILDAYASSAGHVLEFQTANTIYFYSWGTGSSTALLNTTQVFRDISAWYHIILSVDTTQATASNRLKMYVNGVQVTSFATATYPSQNASLYINNNIVHDIGRRGDNQFYFDGYLTEVNFVDGQALTASDFGETNEDTGVWQPKKYTGTYGTNGFYLKGRGTDNSGNGNNWTENNFNTSNSALTTYDIMSDVPTLTNENTGNFAVLNPLVQSAGSFSDGNLKATMTSSTPAKFVSTIAVTSGTWYMEYSCNWGSTTIPVGISADTVPRDYLGMSDGNTSVSFWPNVSSTNMYINGVLTSWSGSATTWTSTDICGLALDATNRIIYVYKNGSLIGSYNFSALNWNEVYFAGGNYVNGLVYNANFGQRPFAYTPPTGYLKLNTFNLPDSSIVDGSQYMNTLTWTGDGTSSRSITGLGFQPDLVWWKNRTTAKWHQLFDSVRGADKALSSNATDAEDAAGGYGGEGSVTSFDSDGFTLQGGVGNNESSSGIVGWSWRGSDSSPVSNTDGTIASTVSANTTAGFSIVTYDPTPSGTVGHGLNTAPELIIEKKRDTTGDWIVGTTVIDGSYDYLRLNTTAAAAASGVAAPTAIVFTPNVGGDSAVAYCFTSVEGYSNFGSYTGNGSTNGPFVYTGFRPAFILVKAYSQVGNWFIMDATRDPNNVATQRLFANLSNAEDASGLVDFTANGFKLRMATALNDAANYIYMAFAENPFKQSLAR